MATNIDILNVRRILGRNRWLSPQSHGPDGWSMKSSDGTSSVIISCAPQDDGLEWLHASIAHADRLPDYDELVALHRAVWHGRGYAYQVFAPEAEHVNIHHSALHLWGHLDGRPALPEFGQWGSI